ncbi:MAG TPA: hypothetical protein DCE42_10775 [Myxococcales bacterium]|nr:hypothetical protein [Deltaproteobacteria bacterium]MBU53974.1 hypothetical protein [Deltaproteobacteria bacterium]HAA55230.1 hypothetical protein [Myxococcales bacterium]|tara:strand:+ start:5601 stop:6356 length:756 start_codon:yes stop_codon:yes gene_type:complete
MHIDLSERTALITGASGGIGRQTALALTRSGAHCVLMARQLDRLGEVAKEAPDDSMTLCPVDLLDEAQLNNALSSLDRHIDIIVHCAAPTFAYNKLHALSQEDTHQQFQVGIHSMTQICAKLLPEMMVKRWGRVVLVSSLSAQLSGRGAAHYNMVKAAQESLARSIALEYGRYRICANTLRLGPIDGPRLAQREQTYPGSRQKMLDKSPSKTLPTPEEVANVIAFFCSTYIAPVNGATLDVTASTHLNPMW